MSADPEPHTTVVTDLRAQLAAAEARLQAIGDGAGVGDRAACRVSGSLLRNLGQRTDRDLARYTAQARVVAGLRSRLANAEAREARAERAAAGPVDCTGARLIRTRHGWHTVVRVSAKSVTVATGHSWTDRIPLNKILEARA